jgi:hypothetical protein
VVAAIGTNIRRRSRDNFGCSIVTFIVFNVTEEMPAR